MLCGHTAALHCAFVISVLCTASTLGSNHLSLYNIILIAGDEKVNRKEEARPAHKAAYEDEVAGLERERGHAREHKQRPDHDRFSHSLGFGELSLHRRPSTFLYQRSRLQMWSVSSQAAFESSHLSNLLY